MLLLPRNGAVFLDGVFQFVLLLRLHGCDAEQRQGQERRPAMHFLVCQSWVRQSLTIAVRQRKRVQSRSFVEKAAER